MERIPTFAPDSREHNKGVGLETKPEAIKDDILHPMKDVNHRKSTFEQLSPKSLLRHIASILACLLFFFCPLTSGGDTVVCSECGEIIEGENDVEKVSKRDKIILKSDILSRFVWGGVSDFNRSTTSSTSLLLTLKINI
jgi:hypothetical protein